MVAYTGVDTSKNTNGTVNTGSSSTISGSVTTVTANSLVLLFASESPSAITGAGTGYTQDENAGTGASVNFAEEHANSVTSTSGTNVTPTMTGPGMQGWATEAVALSPTPPPSAPTSLTATSGIGQISLSWTAPSGSGLTYNVYRSTTSGSETLYHSGVSTTSYTDTSVTVGTTYYYKVTAVNSAGESSKSNEASAAPLVPSFTVTPSPTSLSVQQGSNGTSTITVAPVNGFTGTVALSLQNPPSGITGTFSPTSVNITGSSLTSTLTLTPSRAVTPGNNTVTVQGVSGSTTETGNITLTTTLAPPQAPTNLTTTPMDSRIDLSWTAPSQSTVTSYNLYRSTTSGGEGSTPYKTGITSTSYSDRGLTNGTTYYYKVSAVNATGEGPQSTEASGVPNPTLSVTITSPTNNSSFTAPASVSITATATDTTGTVSEIDFYAAGKKIGSATSSPYTVTWSSVAAGSYTLTAVATDNNGQVETSAPVDIQVNQGGSLAQMTLTSAGIALGFQLSTFAYDFNYKTTNSTGPLATAYSAGYVLVTDLDGGDVIRFTSDADGQDAASATVAQQNQLGLANDLAMVGSNVYFTEQAGSAVDQINPDGTYSRPPSHNIVSIVTNIGGLGLVTNPANGHLFVSVTGHIIDGNPSNGANTQWPGTYGSADGLSISPDGSVLYIASNAGVGDVTGYNTSTQSLVFDYNQLQPSNTISHIDGVALGSGTLANKIIANTEGGNLYEMDLTSGQATLIATNGSRGEFLTPDPNGTLIVSQTDRLLRLIPPPGAWFGGPPSAPVLTATGGVGQVSLSWTAPAGAGLTYNLYRATASGAETLYQSGLTSTSYVDTNVTAGTTYYYEVTAVETGIESLKSNEASATPTAPSAPTLSAQGVTGQVNLTWTTVSGASGYDIYRGTSAGGEGTSPIANNVAGTTYPDSSVTNGVTYYYEVTAVVNGNQSADSNEASATPLAAPVITATAGASQVVVTWPAVTGATGYNIYRATTSGGEGTTVFATSTTNSYTDSAVTIGTTYYYQVIATAPNSASNKSNEASATPFACAAASLSSLTISPTSVVSNTSATGTVTLGSAALTGGQMIALSSSSSIASVPYTVTVPAGQTSATFTITTMPISSTATVTITASYHGSSQQAALQITPSNGGSGGSGGGVGGGTGAGMGLTSTGISEGFSLTTFALGFTSSPNGRFPEGPIGMAFTQNGGLLVTDPAGNGDIYVFPTDVDNQNAATMQLQPSVGSFGLAQDGGVIYTANTILQAGFLFGTVQEINQNGSINSTVDHFGTPAIGLAVNPTNGHLFVSDDGGGQSEGDGANIFDADPTDEQTTLLIHNGLEEPDGLAVSPDGQTLYEADEGSGHVLGFNIATLAQVFDSGLLADTNGVPDQSNNFAGPDGLALGQGVLAGNLYVNCNDGTLWEINLNAPTVSPHIIGSNGSRGDFVVPDPNGSLLLTQSDRILRLTPPPAGTFVPSSDIIYTRDDLIQSNYPSISVANPATSGTDTQAASFDLTGIPSTAIVIASQVQRAGQITTNGEGSFDLQWGISSINTADLASLGPVQAQVQTLGSPYNYISSWNLPAFFYPDIKAQLGQDYQVNLIDQLSSLCGTYNLADTPQANWPSGKDLLSLEVFAIPNIPQGRCQDITILGPAAGITGDPPMNGTWDILLNHQIVASSGAPNGWSVEYDFTPYQGAMVAVPFSAEVANNYEVRFTGQVSGSGGFNVVPATSINSAPLMLPLQLSPNPVTGGPSNNVTCTVTLDAPAPGSGATVSISTTGPISAPTSVTIQPNETTATFTITTQTVSSPTAATVFASYNGFRQAQLGVLGGTGGAPGAPTNLTATAGNAIVGLTWNTVSGATGYNVKRSQIKGGPYTTIFANLPALSGSQETFADTSVTNGTTYYYVVSAVSLYGESANSNEASATPLGGVVATPVITPNGATFFRSGTVILSDTTPFSFIHYTTDGSTPTASSPTYSVPLVLTSNATVKAMATRTGYTSSGIASASFTVNNPSLSARPIQCGETVNGTITTSSLQSIGAGPGWFANYYSFVGMAGVPYTITMTATGNPPTLDPVVALEDQSGNVITYALDYAGNGQAQLVYTPTADGTYIIEATTYSPGATGTYTLNLACGLQEPHLTVSFNNNGTWVNVPNDPNGNTPVNFGQVVMGMAANGKFEVNNTSTGSANLDLSQMTVSSNQGPTGFSLSQPPSSPIMAGQSSPFVLTFTPPDPGAITNEVQITSDDLADTPFTFFVTGSGTGNFGPPNPGSPTISSMNLNPDPVIGGSSVTGTVNLTAAAPTGGATVTVSLDNTASASLSAEPSTVATATITIPATQSSGTFTIYTATVTSATTVNVSASYNNSSVTGPLEIDPASTTLSGMSITPNPVVGGLGSPFSVVSGTVTLSSAAPGNGATVSLTSGNGSIASFSSTTAQNSTTVSISSGQTSGTFTIYANAVNASTNVPITATYNGSSLSGVLTVEPSARLSSLTLNPNPAVGGSQSVTGTVNLSGTAATGGAVITLTSDNPSLAYFGTNSSSTTITIPSGSSSGTVTINTSTVTQATDVHITASYGGASVTATLTLTLQPTVAAPTISAVDSLGHSVPNGGLFVNSATITLLTATSGASIYYTTDGSTPSTSSTLYSSPFTINGSGTTTIKAIAVLTGYINSGVSTANYTKDVPPTVSLTSPANNATFQTGSNITITANASDPNTGGSIARVDFYQFYNTSTNKASGFLGSVTSPVNGAYTFNWNNVPAGTYQLTATAVDSSDNTANSGTNPAPVDITVGNQIPTQTIVCGQQVTGALATTDGFSQAKGNGFYANDYVYTTGSTSEQLTITLTSSAFDTSIYVLDHNTNQWTFMTGTTTNGTSQAALTYPAQAGDTYTIEVTTGAANQTGAYTLSLDCAPTGGTPNMSVSIGGNTIASGTGIYDFGTTQVGSPLTQQVTISNSGTADLQVTNMIVSSDFTTSAATPPVVVPPNGTFSFNLTFNASQVETITTDSISFTNNSTTNPYVFTLKGKAVSGTGTLGVQSLTVNPTSVTGGTTSRATLTLTGPAPTGGAVITLTSSLPSVASVPQTINIPSGNSGVSFNVLTNTVFTNQTVTLTASLNGTSQQATLGVTASTKTPPTVSITSPTSGAIYSTLPASIPITATATAAGSASISSVTFYEKVLGSNSAPTQIGSPVTSSPYTVTWSNVSTPGAYQLTAVATDNNNPPNSTTSLPVSIVVGNALAAPTFAPAAGTYSGNVLVTLANPAGNPAGTLIYYTTDGSTPSPGSASTFLYSKPIFLFSSVNTTITINAQAYPNNSAPGGTSYAPSPVSNSAYTITAGGGSGPSVAITSPSDGAVSQGGAAFPVTGTISSTLATSWVMQYEFVTNPAFNANATDWVTFATGTTAANSNNAPVSGNLDTTLLMNGQYRIRLLAVDSNGQNSLAYVTIVLKGDLKVGYFTLSYTDMTIPVAGIPIQIIRTYDSRDKTMGDFGVGWRLSTSNVTLTKSDLVGQDWESEAAGIGTLGQSYAVVPTRANQITVTMPNGDTYSFAVSLNPSQQAFDPIEGGTVVYTPLLDTRGKATLAPVDQGTVVTVQAPEGFNNEPVQLFTVDDTLYDPQEYQLTLHNGMVYDIKQGTGSGNGLQWAKDLAGNILTFSGSTITETNGQGQVVRTIQFNRGGNGLITSILDPNGNAVSYNNASGNLDSYTDRNHNPTTYDYNAAHDLIGIHNALGIMPLRNYYDATGRLLYSLNANGQQIAYTYNLSANQQTVTDANGNATLMTYDKNGNTIEKDALGSGPNFNGVLDANGQNPHIIKTFRAMFGDPSNPDKPTLETDALGRTTAYTYDPSGDILKKVYTSADGTTSLTTTYTYDGFGHSLTIQNPRHQGTMIVDSTSSYDSLGNLTANTDAMGNTTKYVYYFGTNYPFSVTDAKGNTAGTSFLPLFQGNLTSAGGPGGVGASYGYDSNGDLTSQSSIRTDQRTGQPQTATTQFVYDNNSNLTQTIYPDQTSSQTFYNAIGKIDHYIDAAGRTVYFTYDALNDVIKTTNADNSTTQSVFDANGNKVASEDQMGRWTGMQYDVINRLVRSGPVVLNSSGSPINANGIPNWLTDTGGHPIYTTTFYNDDNTVASETDANGNTTTYGYDNLGRKTSVKDAVGFTTAYQYDADGNRVAVITPAPQGSGQQTVTTHYKYDDDERLIETDYPDGTFTQIGFNKVGQKVSFTDQDGPTHTTQYDYDLDGRLWHVTTPLKEVTTYGYDEAGSKVSQMDGNGHTTHFAYDPIGRLVQKTLPDNTRSESMTYNSDNTTATETDFNATALGNGPSSTYGYDPLTGRLTSISHPDGTGVSYTYYADGKIETETRVSLSGTVTDTYSYDPYRGFLTQVVTQMTTSVGNFSYTVGYGYDDAGNKLFVSSPSGTTSYTYDADERLKSVISPDSAATVYTYDDVGNRASVHRANGITTIYSYDMDSRLTAVANSTGPSYTYSLDRNGQRLSMTETSTLSSAGTTAYSYDQDGRLTSEVGPSLNKQYGYDKVGNRISETVNGIQTSYTYDADDRNTAYTYDANGNVLSNGTQSFTYDYDNEVIAAPSTSYLYDADGTRVQSIASGATTNFVIDTSQAFPVVVEERDASNNLLAHYDYGDDLVRMDRGGSTFYYIFDGSGSTRALTNTSGNVTDAWTYDAFGNGTRLSGSTFNPYLYDGQAQDNTGLYYMRARYYNPQDGRFMSQDPSGGNNSDPISLHRYLYASDDPVNRMDPGGMEDFSLVGLTMNMAMDAELSMPTPGTAAEMGYVARLYGLEIQADDSFLPSWHSLPEPLRVGLDAVGIIGGLAAAWLQGPARFSIACTSGLFGGFASGFGDELAILAEVTGMNFPVKDWQKVMDDFSEQNKEEATDTALDVFDGLAAGAVIGALPDSVGPLAKFGAGVIAGCQDMLSAYYDHKLENGGWVDQLLIAGGDAVFVSALAFAGDVGWRNSHISTLNLQKFFHAFISDVGLRKALVVGLRTFIPTMLDNSAKKEIGDTVAPSK